MLELFLIWLSGALIVLILVGADVLYHKYQKKNFEISLGELTTYVVFSWITVLIAIFVASIVVLFWIFDKICAFFWWLIDRPIWGIAFKFTFDKKQ